jgi:hypothetical protein
VAEAHDRIHKANDPAVVSMPVGQIVGRMDKIRPVAAVMASLLAETDEVLDRLRSL